MHVAVKELCEMMKKISMVILCFCMVVGAYGSLAGNELDDSFFKVPFEKSMSISVYFKPDLVLKDPQWHLAASLYSDFQKQKGRVANFSIMPKKIHFIWLGSPLPAACQKIIDSWRKLNVGWEIIVWNEEKIATLDLINKEAYNFAVNFAEKSDIARYEILYKFGGIYVDTDYLCLKPFDAIRERCNFFAGIEYGPAPQLGNSIIGAIPGHPILKACIKSLKKGTADHNDVRIQGTTGPWFFTKCFYGFMEANPTFTGAVVLPCSFLYPLPWYDRHAVPTESLLAQYRRPESFGFHYWKMSWLLKENLR